MRLFLIFACCVSLAACSDKDAIAFEGYVFKAKVKTERADRAAMIVTVSPAAQSIDGAREAGRYEAIRYCIRHFGKSEIDWTYGPDAPVEGLQVSGDALIFQGRCAG